MRGRVGRGRGAAAAGWEEAGLIPAGLQAGGPRGPQLRRGTLSSSPRRVDDHRLRSVIAVPPPLPRQDGAAAAKVTLSRPWGPRFPDPTCGPSSRSHLAGRAPMLRLPRGMVAAVGPAEPSRRQQR